MPIQNYWMDEGKTLLVSEFKGQWTWNEYYASLDTTDHMLTEISHDADFILDLSDSAGFPPGSVMTHVRNAANRFSDGQFINMAIVGPNTFVRILSDMFRKIYRRDQLTGNTFMVKDLDEAVAMLESYREKIGEK